MSKGLNILYHLRRLNLDVCPIHVDTSTLKNQLMHGGGEGVGVQEPPVGGAGAQGFPFDSGIMFIVLHRLLNT